jgi:hypothetical protein
MGRRSKDDVALIKTLIEKIMLEENETSPSKIGEILEEKYNQSISKPTLLSIVSRIKEKTKSSDLELEYENHPEIIKINGRIAALEKAFKSAEKSEDDSRMCKLNNEIDSAQESKLKMKKTLREIEIITSNSNKAQYIVKFGEPTVVKNTKPVFKSGDGKAELPLKKEDDEDE